MTRSLIIFFLLVYPSFAFASENPSFPTKDIQGSADTNIVGRFSGSYIVSYTKKNFDEVTLPLSELLEVEDKRGNHITYTYKPKNQKTLEGKRTRVIYINPTDTSPLEVIKNYEHKLEEKGGNILYSCKTDECGGSDMSLASYLWPPDNIKDVIPSSGYCAQDSPIADQRYSVIEVPEDGSFVSVHTYLVNAIFPLCVAYNDLTIAVVDVIQVQEMEDKMVVIKAEEMEQDINAKGGVALYGIYFDLNKATLKPESDETLTQIAKLLKDTNELKLLVAGHTDIAGTYESNLILSKKRATAVVETLVSKYEIDRSRLTPVGLSFASPVATNDTEKGRAKNRRVELVKM